MKLKYIVVIFIGLALYSCQKNVPFKDMNVEPAWKFESIHYSLAEGDGMTNDTVVLPDFIYRNATSITQPFVNKDTMRTRSRFVLDSLSLYELLKKGDSVWVKIPANIENGSVWYSSQPALLSTDFFNLPYNSVTSESLDIPSNTVFTYHKKQIFQETKIGFTATFTDSISNRSMDLPGKWYGRKLLTTITYVTLDEIK